MDTLGALALATEPPHDGLMKMPPVGRNAKFITGVMWRNIIGQSIYQTIVLLVLKFRGKQILKLDGPDASYVLNTVIFNAFVFCQVLDHFTSSFAFLFLPLYTMDIFFIRPVHSSFGNCFITFNSTSASLSLCSKWVLNSC